MAEILYFALVYDKGFRLKALKLPIKLVKIEKIYKKLKLKLSLKNIKAFCLKPLLITFK